MAGAAESGFYGKLPCRGDFMQRRVPQAFVDAWDAWLQEALHASRERLGGQWLDLYLTSPVWRFLLAEGICGEMSYAGVMLPSVDRVGRYFPLTVLMPLEVGSCLLEAACGAGQTWFDAAETLARRALDASDLDLEAFDAEVEALAGLLPAEALAQSSRLMELIAQSGGLGSSLAWQIPTLGESPQRAVNAVLSIELERAFRPCALWWTAGSEAIEPGWLVSSGLPSPGRFVAMLSGQWQAAGWNSVGPAPSLAQYGEGPPPGSDPGESRPLEVEIGAAHPKLRHGLAAASEPRFVRRPEIGLWGVVATDGADSSARADLITDVAHDLAPQATLTAQVESARRALQTALGSRAAGAGSRGAVGVVLLLVSGTECALLSSGAVRAVRVRDGTATALIGGEAMPPQESFAENAWPGGALGGAAAGADDSDLLAILAAPATAPASAEAEAEWSVRYERLNGDDLWVLGAAAAIPEALLRELPGRWPATQTPAPDGAHVLETELQALLAQHVPDAEGAPAMPLMLLAARITQPTDP